MSNNNRFNVSVTDKAAAPSGETVDVEVAETVDAPAADPVAETVPTPPVALVDETADGAKGSSRDGSDDAVPVPDNPLVLKNPILINGDSVDELPWTLDITAKQFLDADMRAHQKRPIITLTETDNGFNFELGVSMICAANPRIDPKDLDQIKGRDVMRVMKLGRFFTSDSDD